MENPLISVVIPVYNAERFLREALDSLLAQTYTAWEAICVNDGSTDGSLPILREYAGHDTRFIVLDGPNGGYGKAMNRGLQTAKGVYTTIFEPDDALPAEAYQHMVDMGEKHHADIVKGDCTQFYDEGGRRVFNRQYRSLPNREFTLASYPRYAVAGIDTWCGLYRVDFLREYNILYQETPGASYQDTSFHFLTAAYARCICAIPEPTYLYRVDNPASSVHNVSAKAYAVMEEYRYIQEHLKKTPEIWERVKPIFHTAHICSNIWMYLRLEESRRRDFLKRFRSELLEMKDYGDSELMPELHGLANCLTSCSEENLQTAEKAFQDHERKAEATNILGVQKKISRYLLFFFIPILTCREKPRRDVWNLFGFIPLLVIRKAYSRKSIFLFGFIPLLMLREKKK